MDYADDFYLGHIGIDFGTSNSGFSYLVNNDCRPNTLYVYPRQRAQYPKTRTALLYHLGPNGRAERPPFSWGEAAYEEMLVIKPADQKSHLYVDNFKLALAPEQNAFNDFKKLHLSGLTPEDVIADYLRELSAFARSHIQTRYNTWQFDKTRWALTVPAGWTDAAKDTMRRAAVAAGIITSDKPQSLVLVHEPEAAAVSCVSKGDLYLTAGDTFMVVDAGGGTIDITWHEVADVDGKPVLEDASHREGITHGGSRLDEEFENLLAGRLGDVYQKWKENPKRTADVLDLIHNNWQRVKHSFDGSSQDEYLLVAMPGSLVNLLPTEMKVEFEDAVGWDDRFPLKVVELKRMFDDVVNEVIQKVDVMQSRMPAGRAAPNKVLIVGGLGSNPYFIHQLRNWFGNIFGQGVQVVGPPYGNAAIVEGGVLYARTPRVIHARRALLTYGIRIALPAEKDAPLQSITYNHHYQWNYCDDHLDVLVRKNDLVPIDHKVTRIYKCTGEKQRTISFGIYATVDNKNVKYCSNLSDSRRARIGELVIHIEDPSKVVNPDEYQFEVSMMFGRAEITVHTLDLQTRREASTSLTFARTSNA